jgi:hypothetical protein
MQIRDRIKEFRRVPASQLKPNPKNWRTHPKEQQDALRGVLAEVGMADAVLARETQDGGLMLVDGHMRAETVGDALVPVLVLDVTEEEAEKLLLTIDPIAAMAETNSDALREILAGVSSDSEALASLFDDLAKQNKIFFETLEDDPAQPQSADGQAGDETDAEEIDGPPPSGVRMVQLFLDETNIVDFQKWTMSLSEHYGTENITDTVMECLKRACDSL